MKLKLIKGDITKQEVDIIVNAANPSLLGGGGVDGAIHNAAGPDLLDACRNIRNKQGGCKTGEAVITIAGNLKANHVIHTVGPVWQNGTKNEAKLLENCYRNAMNLAIENKAKSIAFPNISTGIYKFPKRFAAQIALKTIKAFDVDMEVNLVCFDLENYWIYRELLQ
ncbi:MAG: O-acetyl-ADP-ribose deacetylase [Flavobacteriales bacterium]